MPFGCEVGEDGAVRFRLWAPAADRVDVWLENRADEILLPMHGMSGGWFEITTALAAHGSLYYFIIDGEERVTDPASRFQPRDVHGPSQVIDPGRWQWSDGDWSGRPWEEAVVYELHTGAFTGGGGFREVAARLDYLQALGITAVELMPVSDFPGERNWGYDGVLPFAPDSRYGTPDALKSLVQTAHSLGLMVLLDVVYNHFGPEGNYLHRYAPDFFTDRHHTPWGAAINYDGPNSRAVRDFFIHNALYWLEEFHFDGLRLDAVHAILDDSVPDILEELADAVHAGPGRRRHVHLILENDNNDARYLAREEGGAPARYTAQWNDDVHHALHVLATGETSGYYTDYTDAPARHLGRALAEGFAWQGEPSPYRHGKRRGTPSGGLPPAAFVGFLQNHDQVGNRALGERIGRLAPAAAVRAVTAVLLLAPAVPLLFMGQEGGTRRPFPYFCDFEADLGRQVAAGRRREFSRFPAFADPATRAAIPDPNARETFESAFLDRETPDPDWLAFHRTLLGLRREVVVPLLRGMPAAGTYRCLSDCALVVDWAAAGGRLQLYANLGGAPLPSAPVLPGTPVFRTPPAAADGRDGTWPAWFAAWALTPC